MNRPTSALIVDDEAHLRVYLKLILKQLGFEEIYEAVNGQEGVDFYKKWNPELVLMDVNMPVKEGLEALKEILEYDEDAIVVVASSVASRQAVEKSIEYGATYYLRKDMKKEDIADSINKLIKSIWEE